jgi:DNA or RNA helicases of superfamily II
LIDGSIFVSSEVTPELRKSIFDRVRSNEQSVIVCTTLADEGLDIPNLRSLVLAGGGKSSTRALQRVGRVLRPDKGKDYGYVVDIVDDIEYFDEHAERRRKIYQTEPRWRIHDE